MSLKWKGIAARAVESASKTAPQGALLMGATGCASTLCEPITYRQNGGLSLAFTALEPAGFRLAHTSSLITSIAQEHIAYFLGTPMLLRLRCRIALPSCLSTTQLVNINIAGTATDNTRFLPPRRFGPPGCVYAVDKHATALRTLRQNTRKINTIKTKIDNIRVSRVTGSDCLCMSCWSMKTDQ